MKNRAVLGLFVFLTLMTSAVFGSMVENSRQGFEGNYQNSHPVSALGEPRLLLGFQLSFLNLRVGIGIISKDPIGFRGGRNLFVYCGNNPGIYTDPLGLLRKLIFRLFLQNTGYTANKQQLDLYFGFLGSRGSAWDVVEIPLPPEYNSEIIGFQSGYFGCGD